MQTFLPYANFKQSAAALDNRRLGKQRVECLQILKALLGETKGWRNHPATRMWAGHERWLAEYTVAVCDEWTGRGFKDSVKAQVQAMRLPMGDPPPWLGDERLHSSHRSNLMRKAWDGDDDTLDWYLRFEWSDDPDAEYWWPK